MIIKIPREDRYHAHHGWLSSYHLFSFADYFDPNNMNFGALRVFNDDTIDGESGFGTHGHKNMEIITIIHSGELTHKDTIGNEEVIRRGEVQYMSAGTGVMHSEINKGKEKTHLYQIWIAPKKQNLPPVYKQKDFTELVTPNSLTPVVSDSPLHDALQIEADATIYLGNVEDNTKVLTYSQKSDRGVFVYITEGTITINGNDFKSGDQARSVGESDLIIQSKGLARFVLIDVIL